MSLVLLTKIDKMVTVHLRYDKAANPDGGMMSLTGIIQPLPVGPNAFALVTQQDGIPVVWELTSEDIVGVVEPAPPGLWEYVTAKAEALRREEHAMVKAAAEEKLNEAKNQASPLIIQ